jgi:hypothetical protein
LLSEQCRVPHGPGDSKTGQLQCLSRRGIVHGCDPESAHCGNCDRRRLIPRRASRRDSRSRVCKDRLDVACEICNPRTCDFADVAKEFARRASGFCERSEHVSQVSNLTARISCGEGKSIARPHRVALTCGVQRDVAGQAILSSQLGRGGLGQSAGIEASSVWRPSTAVDCPTLSEARLSLSQGARIQLRDGICDTARAQTRSVARYHRVRLKQRDSINGRRGFEKPKVIVNAQGWPLTSVLSPRSGRGGLGESAEIKPGSIWRAYGGMVWATCSQTRLSLCQRERIKVRDCSGSAPPGRTRLLSEQCRVPHGPGDSKTGQLQCLSRRGPRERIKVRDCSGASVPSAANPSVVGRGPAREPD